MSRVSSSAISICSSSCFFCKLISGEGMCVPIDAVFSKTDATSVNTWVSALSCSRLPPNDQLSMMISHGCGAVPWDKLTEVYVQTTTEQQRAHRLSTAIVRSRQE